MLLLLSIFSWSCAKPISSSELFEKLMGASLPAKCTLEHVENAGEGGAVFVVHFPKNDFATFSSSLLGYGEWHPITNQINFEAAGKTFNTPVDLRGKYTSGKSLGGTKQVLVWDEETETLTGMLVTGSM